MKQYRPAVSALVLRPNGEKCELLIVHKPRRNDAWQLPQGGIEEGESMEEAAMRELKEETDIDVATSLHVSELRYAYDFPQGFIERHKPINDGQTLCFVAFSVPEGTEAQEDNHEIDDHKWITINELGNYIVRKEYADIIKKLYDEACSCLAS